MAIGARTIQVTGGCTILSLTQIIMFNFVPLSDRGLYRGILGLTWAFASAIGLPIVHRSVLECRTFSMTHLRSWRSIRRKGFLALAFLWLSTDHRLLD
ncbi:hypothetical protein B0H21DRAFT_767049 [Amylocystis lapponica]|nr:hypothetical protein B0H21DRAFT_767049 [Amylocystis lapponica]